MFYHSAECFAISPWCLAKCICDVCKKSFDIDIVIASYRDVNILIILDGGFWRFPTLVCLGRSHLIAVTITKRQ